MPYHQHAHTHTHTLATDPPPKSEMKVFSNEMTVLMTFAYREFAEWERERGKMRMLESCNIQYERSTRINTGDRIQSLVAFPRQILVFHLGERERDSRQGVIEKNNQK